MVERRTDALPSDPAADVDLPAGDVVLVAETDEDDTSPALEQTRAEIEQTRAAMSQTIEAIKEKLNPQTLVDQAKETVREATVGKAQEAVSNAVDTARDAVGSAVDTARQAVNDVGDSVKETGSNFMETIRENPVPAAIAALGIGWLFMSARKRQAEQERRLARQRAYYQPQPASTPYAAGHLAGQPVPGAAYPPGYPSAYPAGYVPPAGAGTLAGSTTVPIGTQPSEGPGRVGQVVDQVQEKAGEIKDRAQEVVSQAVGTAREAVSHAGETAREVVGHAGETARDWGSSLWENIERNPIPAALAALSLAWFYNSSRRHDADEEGWERRGATSGGGTAYPSRSLGETGGTYGTEAYETGASTTGGYASGGYPSGASAGGAYPQRRGLHRSTNGHRDRDGDLLAPVHRAREEFRRRTRRNPVSVATTALVLGAMTGMLLPETQKENEWLGEARDQLVERAQETAQELGEKAHNVAREVIERTGREAGGSSSGPAADPAGTETGRRSTRRSSAT